MSSSGNKVPSLTDLACMPFPLVGGYLSTVFDLDRHLLDVAVMYATTTLGPKRPWQKTKPLSTNDRRDIALDGSTLQYGVIRGATDSNSPDGHQLSDDAFMRLNLPTQIAEGIAAALETQSMKKIIRKLNRLAAEYTFHRPGITPTVTRLSITGRLQVLRPHMNDVEMATIGGGFLSLYGAAGFYPKLDIAALNRKYQSAFYSFVERIRPYASPELNAYLASLTFPTTLPTGTVGSQVNVTLNDYDDALKAVRQHVKSLKKQQALKQGAFRQRLAIETLSLQNVYLYLLQQLGLCTRPIGPQSLIVFCGKDFGFLVGDKDGDGYEIASRRPCTPTLYAQMQACEADLRAFIRDASFDSCTLTALTDASVARHITLDAYTKVITVEIMSHTDFKSVLTEHSLCTGSPLLDKNNVNRHVLMTALLDTLPFPLLQELMGHAIGDHELMGPWSSAYASELTHLDTAIENILSRLSPKPLGFVDVSNIVLAPFYIEKENPSKNGPRDSLWPANFKDATQLQASKHLRDFLLTEWLAEPRTRAERELACLVFMALDGGVTSVMMELLAKVRGADADPEVALILGIHPKDSGVARCPQKTPCAGRLLLIKLVAETAPDQPLFGILQPSTSSRRRVNGLASDYRQLTNAFKARHGVEAPPWTVLLALAPCRAWFNGYPPWSITAMSRPPLPRSAAIAMLSGSGASKRLADFTATRIPARPRKQIPPRSSHRESKDWQQHARDSLRDLMTELDGITPQHFDTPTRRADAAKAIGQALLIADTFLPPASGQHLVLRWIQHKIDRANGAITPSTLNEYLTRTVYTSLLHDDTDSFDLHAWDEEDFVMLVEERLDEAVLSETTLANTLGTYKELFRFGAEAGFHDTVDLSEFTEDGLSLNTAIPVLIGLNEFDRYLQRCLAEGSRQALFEGAECALAFYGTARPVELARFTLADVYGDDELVAEVRRTKTKGGRRGILLGLLASPAAHEIVGRYLAVRRSEFADLPERRLRDIAFFGAPSDPTAWLPAEMGQSVAQALRRVFGPGVVAYHLRRSGISWLFVRLCVLHDPALRMTLPEPHAAIFAPDVQARLCRLFTAGASQTLERSETTYLFRLAKCAGHRSPRTTFKYYIHTLPIVQRFLTDGVDQTVGQHELKGAVITQLIPGARSHTTQKDLPSRTLYALCERVLAWLRHRGSSKR